MTTTSTQNGATPLHLVARDAARLLSVAALGSTGCVDTPDLTVGLPEEDRAALLAAARRLRLAAMTLSGIAEAASAAVLVADAAVDAVGATPTDVARCEAAVFACDAVYVACAYATPATSAPLATVADDVGF